MPMIKCPECASEIGIRKIVKGGSTKTECPNCFAELTVRQVGDQYFPEVVNNNGEPAKEWEANDADQEGLEEDW